jgi:prepilin-type N-terminal cleavage/methylation domain-containing protein
MMQIKATIRGFTFVEILVVIAILGVIAGLSGEAFRNMYESSAHRRGGEEVYRALTDAQSSTLASEGNTVYGVHLTPDSVTRFTGAVYAQGAPANKVYEFEGGVTATGTLVAGGDVLFARLTGEPSASGTVLIRNSAGTGTTTIVIHASGLIEYE